VSQLLPAHCECPLAGSYPRHSDIYDPASMALLGELRLSMYDRYQPPHLAPHREVSAHIVVLFCRLAPAPVHWPSGQRWYRLNLDNPFPTGCWTPSADAWMTARRAIQVCCGRLGRQQSTRCIGPYCAPVIIRQIPLRSSCATSGGSNYPPASGEGASSP